VRLNRMREPLLDDLPHSRNRTSCGVRQRQRRANESLNHILNQVREVALTERMVIERYSHVQNMVSHGEGELRADLDALDALRYCHPAGTVSGAPKVRAMQIIDELEPVKRGPYAGAVGYLDFRGNLDTCIALRTAIITPGEVHVQAGAGVVADSIPSAEYEETLRKARATLLAIARAGQF
jgi:anthranilate synthase component I